MGTSYETMLVCADVGEVLSTVKTADVNVALVPVGAGRTAVIPRESHHGYADIRDLATLLSETLRCPVMTFQVVDSDVVCALVYWNGLIVDEYLSRQEALIDSVQEADGSWVQEFRGNVYPADVSLPSGPVGDDPATFEPFAVGEPDMDKLAIALSEPQVLAEQQHWDICEALNLDPRGLTITYGQIGSVGVSGVQNVGTE